LPKLLPYQEFDEFRSRCLKRDFRPGARRLTPEIGIITAANPLLMAGFASLAAADRSERT
jgi:hypothetical protein